MELFDTGTTICSAPCKADSKLQIIDLYLTDRMVGWEIRDGVLRTRLVVQVRFVKLNAAFQAKEIASFKSMILTCEIERWDEKLEICVLETRLIAQLQIAKLDTVLQAKQIEAYQYHHYSSTLRALNWRP